MAYKWDITKQQTDPFKIFQNFNLITECDFRLILRFVFLSLMKCIRIRQSKRNMSFLTKQKAFRHNLNFNKDFYFYY